MVKIVITYFFSIVFIFNLMAPSLCSLYSIVIGDNKQHLALDFMDTEKEEGTEKGENETKDNKEKEKSEDEKLKHQSVTALLEYFKNTLRAQNSESKNTYKNLAVAVLTPPPRA